MGNVASVNFFPSWHRLETSIACKGRAWTTHCGGSPLSVTSEENSEAKEDMRAIAWIAPISCVTSSGATGMRSDGRRTSTTIGPMTKICKQMSPVACSTQQADVQHAALIECDKHIKRLVDGLRVSDRHILYSMQCSKTDYTQSCTTQVLHKPRAKAPGTNSRHA